MDDKDIDLGEFKFDVDPVIAEMVRLKKVISQTSEEMKEMRETNDEGTVGYVEREIALKATRKEYNALNKVMAESLESQASAVNASELLTVATETELTSIKQARDMNKTLNKIRNEANLATEEGREQLELANETLDRNNEFIKENVDQYTQQKIGIGDYAGGIKEAFGELDLFNGGLLGFITRSQQAGGAGTYLAGVFNIIKNGLIASTRAAIAFIATGIGAVIAALGLALGAVITYFKTTQEGMDSVNTVTRTMVEGWNVLIGVVQDVGRAIVTAVTSPKKAIKELRVLLEDNVIQTFKGLLTVLEGIATIDFKKTKAGMAAMLTGAKNGYDKAADAAGNFADRVRDGVIRGGEIDDLQRFLDKSEAGYKLSQSALQAEMRLQQLISNDENRSNAEREAAAQKRIAFGKVLVDQQVERLEQEAKILKLKTESNATTDADQVE